VFLDASQADFRLIDFEKRFAMRWQAGFSIFCRLAGTDIPPERVPGAAGFGSGVALRRVARRWR
jgi:hypothetical protein